MEKHEQEEKEKTDSSWRRDSCDCCGNRRVYVKRKEYENGDEGVICNGGKRKFVLYH